jgi:endonuclease-8
MCSESGYALADAQLLSDDEDMPEGDSVRRTARRLDQTLAGEVLVRAELRVPRFATVDLRGMQVLGTHPVGKHMLTRLADESRSWTLHHHLRMDGGWRTGPVGPPRAPGHQIRAWLGTDEAQAVGVRVHMVEVRDTRDEHFWVGHLGPDVLAADFDADAGAARLIAAQRPLVEALLDQRLVCGLGTLWASELAWAARTSPFSATSSVPDLAGALETIRSRMARAVLAPRVEGRGQNRVFERTGRPCTVCGTSVRSGQVGTAPMQRPTYWCPHCQPNRP